MEERGTLAACASVAAMLLEDEVSECKSSNLHGMSVAYLLDLVLHSAQHVGIGDRKLHVVTEVTPRRIQWHHASLPDVAFDNLPVQLALCDISTVVDDYVASHYSNHYTSLLLLIITTSIYRSCYSTTFLDTFFARGWPHISRN